MEYHPYHFGVLKGLLRQQLNGHHWLKLTVADRNKIASKIKFKISENHCKKVLSENGKPPGKLSQQSLDALAVHVGYKSWNHFTISHPLSQKQYYELLKPKMKKELDKIIEQQLMQLQVQQLVLEF